MAEKRDIVLQELKYILPRALFADIAVFALSALLFGASVRTAASLLLGTAAMTANTALLGRSIQKALSFPDAARGKRYILFFYLLRFLLLIAICGAGVGVFGLSPVFTLLPLLWPRIILSKRGIGEGR